MLCKYDRLIYPRDREALTPASFMIVSYRTCEEIMDCAGHPVTQVKAVGYGLPVSEKLQYRLDGRWTRSVKHGLQFEVERYEEVIAPSREGVITYLSSGQIKGIGPRIAERIYDTFGTQTLTVLDQNPNELLTVPGISHGKLEKIIDSYLANRGARDVIAFLATYGISPNKALKFYKSYGKDTMSILQAHPYQLCEIPGVAFKTADTVAMNMGLNPLHPERVDHALLYTLSEAESRGHLCMEKHQFISECLKLLDTPEISENMAAARAIRLIEGRQLVTYGDQVFRWKTAQIEQDLARSVVNQLKYQISEYPDLEEALRAEERKLGLQLAPEQRKAVKTALNSKLCVITGGPGTGKTLIQKALLDLYREQHPQGKIVCCAPTGRAARRMEQSTGVPSATLHKTLGIQGVEHGDQGIEQLEADLVLVDEVSMMDIYLADLLFHAVPMSCRLILIGDADQLPSVGPGAVLSELIACEKIPVIRLDKVYRQDAGSRIALNAKLIRHGNMALQYGNDFQFVDSNEIEQSADYIQNLYLQEVSKYGVDQVALLSPFRKKTATGVNALNERLRDIVNPAQVSKNEIMQGSKKFRVGDKVMQTKNMDEVNNGDIGYVIDIYGKDDEKIIRVDFGDERIVEYESTELDCLDLGYASTVHKSQGSEYKSVIITLQSAHAAMLVRPLLYTAITRARERVTIVGERRAVCIAIRRVDTERRGTRLATRIKEIER